MQLDRRSEEDYSRDLGQVILPGFHGKVAGLAGRHASGPCEPKCQFGATSAGRLNNMYHRIRLSSQERILAWFHLCDLSFNLMKDNLGGDEFLRRLRKMREEKIRANHSTLRRLSRIR